MTVLPASGEGGATPNLYAGPASTPSKEPNNPVITKSSSGGFSAREGRIWKARGKYWVMYDGWTSLDPSTVVATQYLASADTPDGTWTTHGQVIDVTGSGWGHGNVTTVGIYFDPITDELWVFASATQSVGQLYSGPFAIILYKCAAAADWTDPASYVLQNSGTPILAGGGQPWHGTNGVYAPCVLKLNNGDFALFYSTSTSGNPYYIGVAKSSTVNGTYTNSANNPLMAQTEANGILQLAGGGLLALGDVIGVNLANGNAAEYGTKTYFTPDPTGETGWQPVPTLFARPASGAWDYLTMGDCAACEEGDNAFTLLYCGGTSITAGFEERALGVAYLTVAEAVPGASSDDGEPVILPAITTARVGAVGLWLNPLTGVLEYNDGANVVSLQTVPLWTVASGWHTNAGDASHMTMSGNAASTVTTAYRTTAVPANVAVSCVVTFDTDPATANNLVAICARGTGVSGGSGTDYEVDLELGTGAPGVTLYKVVSGTPTAIGGGTVTVTLAAAVGYRTTLSANGTAIAVRVQRDSDDHFLKPDGTWQVSAIDCITATDSAVTGRGNAALKYYGSATSVTVEVTEFSIAAL